MTPDISLWATTFALHDDFGSALVGSRFTETAVGAGAGATVAVAETPHQGVVSLSTGATATGSDGAMIGATSIHLGGGQWLLETFLRLPTLSAVAQEYIARVGFLDVVTGDAVDGAYWEYDRLTSGDLWRAKTSSNSVRTATATTAAPVANTWIRLGIVINDAATQVDFYADGLYLAAHTANIPIGAGRQTSIGFSIVKSAGVTARTLEIDALTARSSFATAR